MSHNQDDLVGAGASRSTARTRLPWSRRRELDRIQADFAIVEAMLSNRTRVLDTAVAELRRIGFGQEAIALASTDLFVEKAQQVLTYRASRMFRQGWLATAAAIALLLIGGALAANRLLQPVVAPSTSEVALRIFQSTALGAFIFVPVKYLIGLARSFFHEAVVLLERRHALRFGRLAVYLGKGDLRLDELTEAFQWNKTTPSSFLDLKPEVLTETLLHKLLDTPPATISALAEVVKKQHLKA